jgi:hypothetical protein
MTVAYCRKSGLKVIFPLSNLDKSSWSGRSSLLNLIEQSISRKMRGLIATSEGGDNSTLFLWGEEEERWEKFVLA